MLSPLSTMDDEDGDDDDDTRYIFPNFQHDNAFSMGEKDGKKSISKALDVLISFQFRIFVKPIHMGGYVEGNVSLLFKVHKPCSRGHVHLDGMHWKLPFVHAMVRLIEESKLMARVEGFMHRKLSFVHLEGSITLKQSANLLTDDKIALKSGSAILRSKDSNFLELKRSFDQENLLKHAFMVIKRGHEGKNSFKEFSVSKSHLRESVDKDDEGLASSIYFLNQALCKGAAVQPGNAKDLWFALLFKVSGQVHLHFAFYNFSGFTMVGEFSPTVCGVCGLQFPKVSSVRRFSVSMDNDGGKGRSLFLTLPVHSRGLGFTSLKVEDVLHVRGRDTAVHAFRMKGPGVHAVNTDFGVQDTFHVSHDTSGLSHIPGVFDNAIEKNFCLFPEMVKHIGTDKNLCMDGPTDNDVTPSSRPEKGDDSSENLNEKGDLSATFSCCSSSKSDATWLFNAYNSSAFERCLEGHGSATSLGPAVHAWGCITLVYSTPHVFHRTAGAPLFWLNTLEVKRNDIFVFPILFMHGSRRTSLPKEMLKSFFDHEPKVPSSMTFGPSQGKICPPDFYASVLSRQVIRDVLPGFHAILKEKAVAWLILSRHIPIDVLKHRVVCHALLLKQATALSDGFFGVVMHGHSIHVMVLLNANDKGYCLFLIFKNFFPGNILGKEGPLDNNDFIFTRHEKGEKARHVFNGSSHELEGISKSFHTNQGRTKSNRVYKDPWSISGLSNRDSLYI